MQPSTLHNNRVNRRPVNVFRFAHSLFSGPGYAERYQDETAASFATGIASISTSTETQRNW
jgi:hypothetical protein